MIVASYKVGQPSFNQAPSLRQPQRTTHAPIIAHAQIFTTNEIAHVYMYDKRA